MNTRRLLTSLAAFSLGLCASSFAADKPVEKPADPKLGYKVVLELKITEAGTVEDAVVASSDDVSVDHILERTAMETARGMKLPPRLKAGKAVKYTARAPFVFSVEDDEGPEANNAPKPSIHSAVQPVYPADLQAKGEVGGAILEAMIGVDGTVSSIKSLRSSNPEFEQAAIAGVKQWVFVPAKKDGVPVESRWRLAISFETDVARAEWKWRFAPRPSLGNYAVVHRTLPPKSDEASPAKAVEKPSGK